MAGKVSFCFGAFSWSQGPKRLSYASDDRVPAEATSRRGEGLPPLALGRLLGGLFRAAARLLATSALLSHGA